MLRAMIAAAAALVSLVTVQPLPAGAAGSDWQGARTAQPSDYGWVVDGSPNDDYDVVVVRGLSPAQVRRTLGTVKRRTRDLTPARAERWVSNRIDDDYEAPRLAVVHRRGRGVLVYAPYFVLSDDTIARLSRAGRAAHYTTTIELDTFVTVARRGRIERRFDALFKPPRAGALPAESGLDWGARKQNVHATAWAFLERVTRIHVSQEWFESAHPAYVFEGTGP